MKMSKSEAGKLGSIKLRENSMARYCLKPKICLQCEKTIEYDKRFTNKFCDHSCSAIYNNIRKQKKVKIRTTLSYAEKRELRRSGIANGTEHCTPSVRRTYLLEDRGYKCEECNLEIWNNKPIPLELHHKDGNSEHNHFDNLQMLYCNCHALTDTHKAKNKGNGRAFRRKMVPRAGLEPAV